MSSIIINKPAFNLEHIKAGYLVIVYDQSLEVVGPGIITSVTQLELTVAVYAKPGQDWHEDEDLTKISVTIEQVVNEEMNLAVINPYLFR